ncbi:MAG TPA: cytochrome c maturation protein CcmE [Cyclobacteriaceae bacterium]|nr:cytochrome c maturation protein CcmE [Cyclobacteriaceae bacterium]HRJ80272.1 cytochrome c maturation protein CcmE [Cyclobacteriaceae bacterium]
MKKSHIFIIVIIAVAVAIIVSSTNDASTYVTFTEAYQMASSGKSKSIHVVGDLKKDASGKVIGIEAGADKVSFSFVMVDEGGKEQKVYYNQPMPQDFIRSEKVVVIGGYKGEDFYAEKILLKCPSKYQEQTLNAGV